MSDTPVKQQAPPFWESSADSTQVAMLLALQWLAYVYPGSELQIQKTLSIELPQVDSDLASRAANFFEQAELNDHVQALEWVAATLCGPQVPAAIEITWRVLLADYQLPAHVPLALRILGRLLDISETDVLALGEAVFEKMADRDTKRSRAPLLPLNPRYLDRIEWRLHGTAAGRMAPETPVTGHQRRHINLILGFALGTVFGALLAVALIFGPLHLGRVKVPVLLHDLPESANAEPTGNSEPVVIEIDPVESAELAVVEIEPVENPQPDVIEIEYIDDTAEQHRVAERVSTEPAAVETNVPMAESSDTVAPTAQQNAAAVTDDNEVDAEPVLMTVTASLLNVRQKASVDAPVVIKLGKGARVWAYPETEASRWIFVQVEGEEGFASASFLQPVEP